MKVVEHLARATRPLLSFEIIPPLRGGNARELLDLIEAVLPFEPPYIDVTSHKAEAEYVEEPDGTFRRKVKRKRPGTLGICALIQHKYKVDAVPHLLCHGFTREETEDYLIELMYLGIHNVLAIRGDRNGHPKPKAPHRTRNDTAADLVRQVRAMNAGRYLEEGLEDAEPSDFCVGVGGYPEKHYEAPNLAADVRWLKAKVDAGADYVVTQMFFDNRHWFHYVEECRAAGITIPIIPGIKVLTSKSQLRSIPRNFHVEIPSALADEVEAADDAHTTEIGVEWAAKQVRELLDRGAPAVHFYIMQDATPIQSLIRQL
ncbi:MAG: methylenetetrahydrofolate reductase [Planctomycetes bacterium]|jgi:methylenetetrahydrofolate reductase (NADPH)|nr:methylenetetrahydrofolate reductase [Planctomycetota bacterium]